MFTLNKLFPQSRFILPANPSSLLENVSDLVITWRYPSIDLRAYVGYSCCPTNDGYAPFIYSTLYGWNAQRRAYATRIESSSHVYRGAVFSTEPNPFVPCYPPSKPCVSRSPFDTSFSLQDMYNWSLANKPFIFPNWESFGVFELFDPSFVPCVPSCELATGIVASFFYEGTRLYQVQLFTNSPPGICEDLNQPAVIKAIALKVFPFAESIGLALQNIITVQYTESGKLVATIGERPLVITVVVSCC